MIYRAPSSGFAPPFLSLYLTTHAVPSALAAGMSADLKQHTPSIFSVFAHSGFMCLGHLSSSLKKEIMAVFGIKSHYL